MLAEISKSQTPPATPQDGALKKRASSSAAPIAPRPTKEQLIKDLTTEKTLYQVWKSSLRIPHSRTNLWWGGSTAAVLLAYAVFNPVPHKIFVVTLALQTRAWADLGFGFASTVLGFLIAGFTIFASLGRPEMFRSMATIEHESKNGFSWLKDGFFRLLRVFAEYCAFLLLCLGVKILAGENGFVSEVINTVSANHPDTKFVFWAGMNVLVGASFVYIAFTLQSFIFNIHHLVMTGIKWAVMTEEGQI